MATTARHILFLLLTVLTLGSRIGCSQYRETAVAPVIKADDLDNPLKRIFTDEEVEAEQEKNFDEEENPSLSS